MTIYIVPIIMVFIVALYYFLECWLSNTEGISEKEIVSIKILIVRVAVIVLIVNTVGAEKYDVFPNAIVLMVSLLTISDYKQQLKTLDDVDEIVSQVSMQRFCELCDKHEENIRETVVCMFPEQIIKIRAELKQKIVNQDKYTIIIFMVTFFGTLLAVEKRLAMIKFGLVLFGISIIACCWILYKKSKYTKALSYLNDYDEKKSSNSSVNFGNDS